eukprot:gene398-6812_t
MEEKKTLLKFTLSNYPNFINEDDISFDELNEEQINSVDIQILTETMKQNQKIYFNLLFNFKKKNNDSNESTPNSATSLSWPSPSSNPMTPKVKKGLPMIPKKELPKIPTKPLPTPTISKDIELSKPIRAPPKPKMTDDEMYAKITREEEYNNEDISYDQRPLYLMKFKNMTTVTYEQFQLLAYESLLLSTSFLTEIPSDYIQGVLFFIRDYLKIKSETHESIMKNLSVLENIKINISTDPGKHKSKYKNYPIEINHRSTLNYRMRLLQYNSNEEDFRKRNSVLCCNSLIGYIRSKPKYSWDYHNSTYLLDEFEDVIYSIFKKFSETGNYQEIEGLSLYIFEQLNLPEDSSISFPINMYLYELLCEPIVNFGMNTYSGYNDNESTLVFDTLSCLRRDWKINNILHNISYLSALFQYTFFSNNFEIEDKLYKNLITRIKAYKNSKLDEESKKYFLRVLSSILKGYGGNFIDIIGYYLGDYKTLEEHLSLYHLTLSIWCSFRENDTGLYSDVILSECLKTILNQTLEKIYFGLKIIKKSDSELHTLINMIKDIEKELKIQQQDLVPAFSPFFPLAKKRSIYIFLRLLSLDVKQILVNEKNLSEEIIELCSFLRDELIKYDAEKSLWNIINYEILLEEVLSKWIQKVQKNFTEYLDTALKLEKWEPISQNVLWSTSAQDLFNFIESTLDLKHLILPGTSYFVRGYVQCCAGLVQNFVFLMTSAFPDPSDLIPILDKLPVIQKEEKKSGLNLKILKKSKINNVQTSNIEKKKISKDHNNLTFQTAHLRLNNIIFVRDKLTKYIDGISDSYFDFQDLIPDLPDMDIHNLWVGTTMMISESIERISNYIAIRNVYIELKPILNDLYIPKPSNYNIRSIIDEHINSFIQATQYLVPDETIANFIILNTFKQIILYLSIIILDGKKEVIFSPSDFIEILYDIQSLEDLFSKSNSHISSKRFILKCTNRLKSKFRNYIYTLEIAQDVMSIESKDLIDGNEELGIIGWEKYPLVDSNSVWSKQIIYKVLKHRDDSIAQKFIEKTSYTFG